MKKIKDLIFHWPYKYIASTFKLFILHLNMPSAVLFLILILQPKLLDQHPNPRFSYVTQGAAILYMYMDTFEEGLSLSRTMCELNIKITTLSSHLWFSKYASFGAKSAIQSKTLSFALQIGSCLEGMLLLKPGWPAWRCQYLYFSIRPSSVSIGWWLSVSQSPAWLCAIVCRIGGRDEASHPFAPEEIEGAHVLHVLPSSHVVTWSDHFHKRIHSLHQRFEMSSRRLAAAAKLGWHLGAAANKWCGRFSLIFLRNSGLGINWWDAAIWFFNRHDFTVTRHDENFGSIVARIISCTNTKLNQNLQLLRYR